LETFQLESPEEVYLLYRSAPWDDIIDEELISSYSSEPEEDQQEDDQASVATVDSIQLDSPVGNIIGKPPPPTHHKPPAVVATAPEIPLQDPFAAGVLQQGIHLPPPAGAPSVFQVTPSSPLMD
jgi:hypothetical protein